GAVGRPLAGEARRGFPDGGRLRPLLPAGGDNRVSPGSSPAPDGEGPLGPDDEEPPDGGVLARGGVGEVRAPDRIRFGEGEEGASGNSLGDRDPGRVRVREGLGEDSPLPGRFKPRFYPLAGRFKGGSGSGRYIRYPL